MAEVVVEQGANQAQNQGALSGFDQFFQWLGTYWWVLLIIFLIIVGIGVLIYLLYFWNMKQKRKDIEFLRYERTLDSCKLNSQRTWIKKRRKWWFIPVFGTLTAALFGLCYLYLILGEHWIYFWMWVVFGYLVWLPIVLSFYTDLSMKILNVEKKVVGYYRGHTKRMDGYIYVIIKVGKKWVLFDDKRLLRLPEDVLTLKTIVSKDDKGNVIKRKEFDKVEIRNYVWNERDNYIFIPMVSIVLEDTYYYSPTLVDDKGKILDLRQKIAESYHLQSGIQILESNFSNVSRLISDAVDSNVVTQAMKKQPQKQTDVNANNNNNEG